MMRGMIITHNDGTPDLEMEISKANLVRSSERGFVYMEEMADGKWRLTYTDKAISDFSKIAAFRMIRRGGIVEMPEEPFHIKTYRDLLIALSDLDPTDLDRPLRLYEAADEMNLFTVETTIERDGSGDPFLDLNFLDSDYIDR
ncbi:hypothetical protein GZH47_33495 (plasmid) [Paenibacillus rhizovicinus]|uniref:Uncharacterized protein n=1 Tax=Paenibacillus rhizovicinus TaxID=2704463 RepID=A0A6C0PBI7_9BACL|nr:hypothetical protein [Paenibacillus rhizovicinus]QHW35809.1 hypothetical protein GZH47_33495 [Paenibacillus rhizovicinus]